MKFRTSRFGEIEIPDASVLFLKEGILGFPGEKRYVLLDHDAEGTPFKWLQAVDNPALAFVVIDPTEIVSDYCFPVEDDVAEQLQSTSPEDYIPMVICNIPRDDPAKMTANLRGPVIVNIKNRNGRQIILKDEVYAFDHRVFARVEREE